VNNKTCDTIILHSTKIIAQAAGLALFMIHHATLSAFKTKLWESCLSAVPMSTPCP